MPFALLFLALLTLLRSGPVLNALDVDGNTPLLLALHSKVPCKTSAELFCIMKICSQNTRRLVEEESIADAVKLLLQAGALVEARAVAVGENRSCADASVVARELKLYRY